MNKAVFAVSAAGCALTGMVSILPDAPVYQMLASIAALNGAWVVHHVVEVLIAMARARHAMVNRL